VELDFLGEKKKLISTKVRICQKESSRSPWGWIGGGGRTKLRKKQEGQSEKEGEKSTQFLSPQRKEWFEKNPYILLAHKESSGKRGDRASRPRARGERKITQIGY